MTDWPKYQSHKIIQAAVIVGITVPPHFSEDGKVYPAIWVRPAGEEFDGVPIEQFEPTVPEMAAKAKLGDYAMLYPDGYKSISPAKQFEDGYTCVLG